MIGSAWNARFSCTKPISPECIINPAQSFRCFNEYKIDPDLLHLHGFYFFPVDIILVVTNIDAMDPVIDGNINSKRGIANKFRFVHFFGEIPNADRSDNEKDQWQAYHP